MTGIIRCAQIVTARLVCDAHNCKRHYDSTEYVPESYFDDVRACEGAFRLGWRVFVGARSQMTYCPDHGPKREMRLVYPADAGRREMAGGQ